MYESLGIDFLDPREASVLLGLAIGLAFGVLALATGFCFRRALAGPREERGKALGLWLVALAAAVIGTQAAQMAGWLSFADHRFLALNLPWLSILLGGFLFGVGMVLTRGCASRLTVLAATGNLRAVLVMVVFAVVAMATMRGVLAPVTVALAGVTVSAGGSLPGPGLAWAAAVAFVAIVLAIRARVTPVQMVLGAMLGLLVPIAWLGTGYILFDDFDPIPFESLSFTGPTAESLLWVVAATGIEAGFATGLIGGTLLGAFLFALVTRGFRWQSFSTPLETGRYMTGAALMGFGGVLAGGCTVGAGLAGVPTLGFAAILALAAIAAGGLSARAVLESGIFAPAAPEPRQATRRGV